MKNTHNFSCDPNLTFDDHDFLSKISLLSDTAIDNLDFGVIGFDSKGIVQRYNKFESEVTGISASLILGRSIFNIALPCANNYLVAQRFEDAAANDTMLDDIIDYVLTPRMRPVKVSLRLLALSNSTYRYVLVRPAP